MAQMNLPDKLAVDVDLLKKIYDDVTRDITRLLNRPGDVNVMRVVLGARKIQLRTAEVKLQQLRLFLQYQEQNGKQSGRRMRGIRQSDNA